MLAIVTMAVYTLVVLGATTGLREAARACSGWPLCAGPIFPISQYPLRAIALSHRIAAGLSFGLLLIAVIQVRKAPARIRHPVWIAAGLFPVQIAIGAAIASYGLVVIPSIHLAVGMVIFVSLLVSLVRSLSMEADMDAHPLSTSSTVTPIVSSDADGSASGPLAVIRAYIRMTKPRLMWLLCLVAGAGMALAAQGTLPIKTVIWTLLGGVLSIGASGTFNHILERNVDRQMQRTADRPLATDIVGLPQAILFGVALAIGSIIAFLQVNVLVAFLGVVAIGFYSVVYTLLLKPNTVQNTVIGGAAGALPALIGWAAVTDSIGLVGIVLAALIFVWTPAHFYNLALAYREDYARGGFPMLPVVAGIETTYRHIIWYLGATLLVTAILVAISSLGFVSAITAVVFGGVFLLFVVGLHREGTTTAAMRAFHASNAYLGMVLLAIVVDSLAL